jgi:plastocyanin
MLRTSKQTSKQIFIALVALIVSQSALAKALVIQVVDKNGLTIPNAVISFPQIKATKQINMVTMDQVNKQFAPHVLMIQKNQLVDFPNSDHIRHHVYSFSQPNQFEIKLFSGSEAQPISFKNEGVVVLGCNIHDNMIGYIYVTDGELVVMTDKSGNALVELSDDLSIEATTNINIWHPLLSPIQTERVEMELPENIDNYNITLPFALEIEKPKTETDFGKKFGY